MLPIIVQDDHFLNVSATAVRISKKNVFVISGLLESAIIIAVQRTRVRRPVTFVTI